MIITKQYVRDNLHKSALEFFEKNFTTPLDTDKIVVTGGDRSGFWEHIKRYNEDKNVYDHHGNLLSRECKTGSNTFKYDDQNRQIECRYNGDIVTYHKYDKRGNLVEHMTHTGFIEKKKYNKRNELIWDISSRLETTRVRNKKGLMTKLIESDNDGWKRITAYKYDANGNILMINHNNKTTTVYRYDSVNRLIYEKSPCGDVTSHEYDKLGRKTKRRCTFTKTETTWRYIDKRTIITTKILHKEKEIMKMIFDKNGKEVYRKNELGETTHRWYNKHGNLTKEKNNRGGSKTIKYDYKQRVVEKICVGYMTRKDPIKDTWKYNRKDQLVATSDGWENTQKEYRYDKRGNLIYRKVLKGKKTVCIETCRYHHNKQGNLTSIVYCDKYKQMTIKYL